MKGLSLLKRLLKVPAFTLNEGERSRFVADYCRAKGYQVSVDVHGNVFVTKGQLRAGEFYASTTAHLDTIYESPANELVIHNNCLVGFDARGHRCGVGGDDTCGLWIALRLLDVLPVLKFAAFIGEESFMVGSTKSSNEFFKDVGYCIGLDCPGHKTLGYTCNGLRLFENQGRFIETLWPILQKYGCTGMGDHPYTDIYRIKERNAFQCVNLPVGYYNPHSPTEFINLERMDNAYCAALEIIRPLGNNHYAFTTEAGSPPVPVTPFNPADFFDSESLRSVSVASLRVMKEQGLTSLEQVYQLSKTNPKLAGKIHKLCLQAQQKELGAKGFGLN